MWFLATASVSGLYAYLLGLTEVQNHLAQFSAPLEKVRALRAWGQSLAWERIPGSGKKVIWNGVDKSQCGLPKRQNSGGACELFPSGPGNGNGGSTNPTAVPGETGGSGGGGGGGGSTSTATSPGGNGGTVGGDGGSGTSKTAVPNSKTTTMPSGSVGASVGGGSSSTTTTVSHPSPSPDVLSCYNSGQTADRQKLLQGVSNFCALYSGVYDVNRAESVITKFPWDDAEGAAIDVLVQLSGTTNGCLRGITEV